MNRQNGFTLVELIVTSAISLMIGGLILTVFLVNGDQFDETTVMLKMSQHYGVAAEQIKRVARASRYLKAAGDTPGNLPGPFTGYLRTDRMNTVFFCGIGGDTLGGYRIQSSMSRVFLDEWNTALRVFQPFLVSPTDSVILENLTSSYFRILEKRGGVEFTLVLKQNVAGTTSILSTKTERALCRNAGALP